MASHAEGNEVATLHALFTANLVDGERIVIGTCGCRSEEEPPTAYAELDHIGKKADFRVSCSAGRKTHLWPSLKLVDSIENLVSGQKQFPKASIRAAIFSWHTFRTLNQHYAQPPAPPAPVQDHAFATAMLQPNQDSPDLRERGSPPPSHTPVPHHVGARALVLNNSHRTPPRCTGEDEAENFGDVQETSLGRVTELLEDETEYDKTLAFGGLMVEDSGDNAAIVLHNAGGRYDEEARPDEAEEDTQIMVPPPENNELATVQQNAGATMIHYARAFIDNHRNEMAADAAALFSLWLVGDPNTFRQVLTTSLFKWGNKALPSYVNGTVLPEAAVRQLLITTTALFPSWGWKNSNPLSVVKIERPSQAAAHARQQAVLEEQARQRARDGQC